MSGLERSALLLEYRLVSGCSGSGGLDSRVASSADQKGWTVLLPQRFSWPQGLNIPMHQRRHFMSTWAAYVGTPRRYVDVVKSL